MNDKASLYNDLCEWLNYLYCKIDTLPLGELRDSYIKDYNKAREKYIELEEN